MHRQIQKILSLYNLNVKKIYPPQKGYRNRSFRIQTSDRQDLNLMIYKREPGILKKIRNANYVSDFLANNGFPARCTYGKSKRIVRLYSSEQGVMTPCSSREDRFASLYNYLPGQTIPWEGYTMKHLKLLGKTMSDMHYVLKDLPRGNVPDYNDELKIMSHRMETYFSDHGVCRAMKKKLKLSLEQGSMLPCPKMTKTITRTLSTKKKQILHMDFVRSNILFQPIRDELTDNHTPGCIVNCELCISGILDFEKTLYGPPILDIARTLAFLLVDCKYKPGNKIRKYFLYSGYSKRGKSPLPPLTPNFELLVSFFLLYDFYKFLKHNVYEDLNQNEHFIRTRNILVRKGFLKYAIKK